MKMNFYAIYDKAVGAYMRPFVLQSDGQAVRGFTDEVNNPETPLHAHPEDYALFRIGIFDDSSAVITPEEPTCLARAHEIKKRELPIPSPDEKEIN